jgi:hypothetical protein
MCVVFLSRLTLVFCPQYFWYVRDDDSSDQFFGSKDVPEPVAPPKKKGLFGKKAPEPVAVPPPKKKWF